MVMPSAVRASSNQRDRFVLILNAKGKRYLARDLLLMMRVVIVRLVSWFYCMQRYMIFSKRTNFSCFLCDLRQLFLSFCVFVAKQCDCRNNFRRKAAKNLFLIENCHNFAATKETNDNLLTTKNIAKSFNI